MIPIVSSAQMKALEQAAAGHGLSEALLMEEAGRQLAQVASQQGQPGCQYVVFCGSGNNGGDGYVAARQLHRMGRIVEAVAVVPAKTEDAQRNARALTYTGVNILKKLKTGLRPGDVVVDCLLGTGLRQNPQGACAAAIRQINALAQKGIRVVAADLPSGVAADTGMVHSPAVVADVTVAFGFLKPAHCLHPALGLLGKLTQVDIGLLPLAVKAGDDVNLFLLEEAGIRQWLPRRNVDSHKGTFGHVLVVAGRPGRVGAAALAAKAALVSGAGLVSVASESEVLPQVLVQTPELMGHVIDNDKLQASLEVALGGKAAIVLGPGLGTDRFAAEIVESVMSKATVPRIVDADALNVLAANRRLLSKLRPHDILTPHPGEMARLLQCSIRAVQSDRVRLAQEFAKAVGATVVLKGAQTVIASPKGKAFVNPTGNPGMATAGSGDVLGGIVAGLVAQGGASQSMACVGTFVHGLAGDFAAEQHGQRGMVASDIVNCLSKVWLRWNR